MPKPFHQLTIDEFVELLASFPFTRRIDAVHMHHTWQPDHSQYRGLDSIESMWRHHTQTNGWSDIAQHVTIAPDGSIWTGRNWNQPPASSAGYNGNKESGPFMFEAIGNFDEGHDSFDGAQKRAVLEVIGRVQHQFNLPVESLRFHNTMSSKSCPGTSIAYAQICQEVSALRGRLASEGTRVAGTGYPFDDHQRAIWKVMEDLSGAAPAARGDELNGDICEHLAAFSGSRTVPPPGPHERTLPQLTPDILNKLRPHVVNLNQGRFSSGGEFQSDKGSVDAIFHRHLEKELERNGGKKLRIVFYAHGGLISEGSALWMAAQHLPWWRANNIYPIFFVWETGLLETLIQLFGQRARDLEEVSDRVLQTVARNIGGVKIWSGMKVSAERSTGDPDGGALYVAQKLTAFLAKHNTGERERVEAHAVGHSAGAIFHGYFAPAVIKLGGSFKTMHFLAPAIRTDTFQELLASHVGKGIGRLTLYTMTEDYEKKDNCGPYRKSLLYLIYHALEPERLRPTPILGLDESLRNDPELVELFDYYQNNPQAPGDIVWSVSEATDGPSASHSTTHGGFDEDIPTMTSIALRILDANDAEKFPDLPPREIGTLEAMSKDDPEIARWLGGFSAGEPATLAPVPDRISIVSAVQDSPGTRGAMRALCVGINRYPTAPLAGCVADAQEWQATFKQLGFTDVAVLVDQQATRYAISSQLTRLINESRPGDVIAFQFAGHGTQLRDLDGDESNGDSPGQDEAMCPFDFAQGHFLIDDDLAQSFNRIPEGVNVTCFIDCCHSGTVTRLAIGTPPGLHAANGAGDERARFLPATAEMEEAHAAFRASLPLGEGGNREAYDGAREVLFCACRSREVALESNGHGHFTTKAIQVLRAGIQGLTNEELLRRILQAFGAAPRQNPELHCAPAFRGRPLLGFDSAGGRSVSVSVPFVSGTSEVRYSAEQVAELLKALTNGKNI